jgi:fructokinase
MIVVCGEALMDVFVEGETPAGLALHAHDGGSPFNLAIGLARLGVATTFFGGLSNDLFGARLTRKLVSEGVHTDAAPYSDAPTALVIVSLDDAGSPTYRFYGERSAERNVTRQDLARVPRDATTIHVGSYCTVVEPVASSLRALIERQRGTSLLSYDPNVRLTIEPDLERWRDALEWMLVRVDVVKISDEDLACLYPDMNTPEFIAKALTAGAALVVVTHGARGVVACSAAGVRLELPAAAVNIVDTVGAGDSFQAALLAWMTRHQVRDRNDLLRLDLHALEAAMRFASQAAAITCGRRGPDLPRLQDLTGAV